MSSEVIYINTYNAEPDSYLRETAVKNLCEKFNFLRLSVIGRSLCGRKIQALTIGSRKSPILYAAAFHGSEWLNILFMLRFAEEVCESYSQKTKPEGVDVFKALQRRGLVIIPCVNPDGVEIALRGSGSCPRYKALIDSLSKNPGKWQANARGIDLNHNFNAGFRELKRLEREAGIVSPAPTRYGGERPFSEPETVALRNLCLRSRFHSAAAFHSQGREVYCTYGRTPEKSVLLGETFAALADYRVSVPEKLATGGGFKDWMIGFLNTPAITVETGLGENPLPLRSYPPEYERIRSALFRCILV